MMRVPQRVDYALRFLVLLAAEPPGTYMAAGAIADRLLLPRRFVEQQATELARAGLVIGKRGAAGGSGLARPSEKITVRDVVLAIQGDILDVPHQTDSATAELWLGAAASLDEYLGGVTVEQLAARQRSIDARTAPMYFI
jgi:Rrf2 family protein